MGQIKVEYNISGIKGLHIINPTVHSDERGYFYESYNKQDMLEAGINVDFVQDNQSRSQRGVLRGLHFQIQYPQTKLVRVISGKVYDVAVDLRKDSDTFGKYFGVELSDMNRKQFLIPRGFAHGFLVLSEYAEFCYKCDDFYHPNDEGGIAWNDPGIGIKWPMVSGIYDGTPRSSNYSLDGTFPLILSEKDQKWGLLEDLVN